MRKKILSEAISGGRDGRRESEELYNCRYEITRGRTRVAAAGPG